MISLLIRSLHFFPDHSLAKLLPTTNFLREHGEEFFFSSLDDQTMAIFDFINIL